MILRGLPSESGELPVIVVGAGPAGLVHSLELRRRGVPVLVLAGGADGFDSRFQDLAEAEIAEPVRHAPMAMAVRRALGGTSLLWGGRCVPFDAVDFAARPQVPGSGWPIDAEDAASWYPRAMTYLDAGAPRFSLPLASRPEQGDVRFDRLERWSEGRDLRRLHADALARDPGLRICLGAVAVGLEIDPVCGHVAAVTVADPSGARRRLAARAFVLACGGLETTRLLLTAQRERPRLFGGAAGPLGRYYMGHVEGRIAEIVLTSALSDAAFGFLIDTDGRYVRRRIAIADEAQQRHGLLNLAAWPDNPALRRPEHRSAILSLAALSLATPGLGRLLAPEAIRRKHLKEGAPAIRRHLANVLRGLPEASREAAKFLYRRFVATPRLPGFFLTNRARRYTFLYHAEQAPNAESRVTLSERRDALGMPRLRIDLRFGEIDARSVIASHAVIDRELRRSGIGRLEYTVPEAERFASILEQATDGFHQIGTIRMAAEAAHGVVDRECRVHGAPNLFVASSAVFPTSGQANPTLLVAALSARLAEHVAGVLAELDAPAAATPARAVAG